jgi:hypothetical protein
MDIIYDSTIAIITTFNVLINGFSWMYCVLQFASSFSSVSKVSDLQFYINLIVFQAPNQEPPSHATPEISQKQKLGDPSEVGLSVDSDKVMTGDYPSSLVMGYKIHMFNVRQL